jgi:hypothetical protein
MDGLAAEAAAPKTVMIDATYLKALRTAMSLRSKEGEQATKGGVLSAKQVQLENQVARRRRCR